MKKKIDERIRTLIENCVKTNHRSLFLIVGDRGIYQIVNLHAMLQKARVKAQPSILWCYSKSLELSSHQSKRLKQVKKLEKSGVLAKEEVNQIDQFMSNKEIRYTYYKDTHKILGQTHGMCILQDFESITPNVLCRAMETVEGGGVIVMLFNTLTSLKQLYELSMDVHGRYRTEGHSYVKPRFNERFILSLAKCMTCMAIDDELNILPITKSMRDIVPVHLPGMKRKNSDDSNDIQEAFQVENLYLTPEQKKLKDIKLQLKDSKPIGPLVALAATYDQATSLMELVDKVSEKSMSTTISLTAGRGRGKSASLGLTISSAIVYGLSNIFVTAPHPDNLKTVFEFLFRGLDTMGYKEHQDYEILQSTNPDFNHAIVRVNIYKDHRQCIQYVQPGDWQYLAQAELVVVDEAAAIPVTLVKKLLGSYMVILSSTVAGYEGTGRSLSLKLLTSLREQNQTKVVQEKTSKADQNMGGMGSGGRRTLTEVTLDEPIRYGINDPVERWLNDLLCLDATSQSDQLKWGFPHPDQCQLYLVNRDTLFSYHESSEQFLAKLMSIFVSSHYKNTPNDLQMLSDAPAHQIFVLLGPLEEPSKHGKLPDILCAIQVAFEGEISRTNIAEAIRRGGQRPAGDLIPWTIAEQYQDDKFGQLNGIRIVRIATNPTAQTRGYGSRALEMLYKYYEGKLIDADCAHLTSERDEFKVAAPSSKKQTQDQGDEESLQKQKLKARKDLKPILQKLSERQPLKVHWIGTSFGLTRELFSFWQKNQLQPLYIRQTANELTGEHSCLMIKPITHEGFHDEVVLPGGLGQDWLQAYTGDFQRRMSTLLGFEFRALSCRLAYQLVNSHRSQVEEPEVSNVTIPSNVIAPYLNRFDLKRLESYSRNMVDFHLIMDLVPTIARLYFQPGEVMPAGLFTLSPVQAALITGVGLQFKCIDDLTVDLNLPAKQLLAMFNKAMNKITAIVRNSFEQEIEVQMAQEDREAKAVLQQLKSNKKAQMDDVEEPNDMVTNMKNEKNKFIEKHSISAHHMKQIESGDIGGKLLDRVRLPRKREAESDVEDLEETVIGKDKKDKKGKSDKGNKRKRTK